MENNLKENLKKPSPIIAVAQLIVFVACYIAVSYILALLAAIILDWISLIPLINTFSIAETIVYTFRPLLVAIVVFVIMLLVFQKYLFNTISMVICFMFVSYHIINQIIIATTENGILSWELANTVWSGVVLAAAIIFLFKDRTECFVKVDLD